jgi:hypothetical protein
MVVQYGSFIWGFDSGPKWKAKLKWAAAQLVTRMKSLLHPGILGASSSWWTMSPPAAAPASAETISSARTAAAAI